MATADEIAALRLLIAEPDDADPYTDAKLGARLDSDGDPNLTAYSIWTEKAASAASLVNISEGGSSRSMGDLHEQALNMAGYFGKRLPATETPIAAPTVRIRRLSRP